MFVLVDMNLRDDEKAALRNHGFFVLCTTPVGEINNALSTHPDIQIHFLNSNTAICEPTTYSYYKKLMPGHIRLISGKSRCTSTYPKDCAYNVTRIGQHIFANTGSADATLLDYYQKEKFKIHHVRQGYTKCNTCIISDQSVITEDVGLHNIFIENNIRSFLIENGGVALEGYQYGFIGGASGSDGKNVYFSGLIEGHPWGDEIKRFIKEEGKEVFSLSKDKLRDNGSMFFFE